MGEPTSYSLHRIVTALVLLRGVSANSLWILGSAILKLLNFPGMPKKLHVTKHLKSCVNPVYSFVNVKVIFQNIRRIKSLFPYKDRLNRSQLSKVIYKASCWDCNDFYIGKTKRRLHDRKTEHFKALLKNDHSSAIADHVKNTGLGPF